MMRALCSCPADKLVVPMISCYNGVQCGVRSQNLRAALNTQTIHQAIICHDVQERT